VFVSISIELAALDGRGLPGRVTISIEQSKTTGQQRKLHPQLLCLVMKTPHFGAQSVNRHM